MLVISIIVIVIATFLWWGLRKLEKPEMESETAVLAKPVEEKTTPVSFAEFSLNEEFRCPVCKKVSKTDDCHGVVFCSHCRTPHHVNCYKFIGHCSIYACRGQKDPATYQKSYECGGDE